MDDEAILDLSSLEPPLVAILNSLSNDDGGLGVEAEARGVAAQRALRHVRLLGQPRHPVLAVRLKRRRELLGGGQQLAPGLGRRAGEAELLLEVLDLARVELERRSASPPPSPRRLNRA